MSSRDQAEDDTEPVGSLPDSPLPPLEPDAELLLTLIEGDRPSQSALLEGETDD